MADAQRRRLSTDQWVRVHNSRGSVRLKCRISADVKPGIVVISEGTWVKDFADGDPYSLTHERICATSELRFFRCPSGSRIRAKLARIGARVRLHRPPQGQIRIIGPQ